MEELISVIIPAYNVEKYLRKCVESVVQQTWKNIEILLVDDGSTDTTGRICDDLACEYRNIKVFHQKNAGLSVARNTGLDNCKGEWIAFLDSDDWVDPDMYETLYRIAIEHNVSLSSCLSRDVVEGKPNCIQEDGRVHLLEHFDIINGLQSGNIMRFEVWNKLWKRDLIGDVRFVAGQIAEDVHFDSILFEKTQKIAHINKAMHYYLISRPGNTNSSFKVARLCIFDEFREWQEKLEMDNKYYLAYTISAIAANFSVDIYGNAIRAKQSDSVLNELKKSFHFFFPYAMKSKMPIKRRLKLLLFRASPASVKMYR